MDSRPGPRRQPSAPGDEKLVLWDIKASKEIQRYEFPAEVADKTCSFLNDIVVDNHSGFAYITDSGIYCDPLHGGLIVFSDCTKKPPLKALKQKRTVRS